MGERVVSDEAVKRFLRKLPNEAASQLQAIVKANHNDHKKEIVNSMTFKTPEARRRMSFAIKVFPKGFVNVEKIEQVEGETVSFWRGKGTNSDAAEGAAWKVDASGDPIETPKRGRFLVIPWSGKGGRRSPLMTAKGRPTRGKSLRDLSNIIFRKMNRNPKVLIAFRKRRSKSNTDSKFPDQVVALLVPAAEHVQGMDFFGAWERLDREREERYRKLLDRLAKG